MIIFRGWLGGILFAILLNSVYGQPWEFSKPLEVTASSGEGIFHHLESSGRRNIAVSGDTIAVAWEDNRDGTPRIYLARKTRSAANFSSEIKISGDGEAYEPSLVALEQDRFALAWEEADRIHARLIGPSEMGPVIVLGETGATQASLAVGDEQLFLVFSQPEARFARVWLQPLAIDALRLRPLTACPVDANPPIDDQFYPTLVSLATGLIVAWEDRRPGHTIIMAAQNNPQTACKFSSPQRISERPPGPRMPYGKGHGVARVALASYGSQRVLAVWADKRDFREGYDIYAADYPSGSNAMFGPNMRVQDSFGGYAQQWHASAAGHTTGSLVVAWDDNRDGDANIMLSWRENGEWSDDLAVPGATGAGEQNHPSLQLDQDGNLHLAWIERTTVGGPTRVRYLFAKVVK